MMDGTCMDHVMLQHLILLQGVLLKHAVNIDFTMPGTYSQS